MQGRKAIFSELWRQALLGTGMHPLLSPYENKDAPRPICGGDGKGRVVEF